MYILKHNDIELKLYKYIHTVGHLNVKDIDSQRKLQALYAMQIQLVRSTDAKC